jgi:hypothetical protein
VVGAVESGRRATGTVARAPSRAGAGDGRRHWTGQFTARRVELLLIAAAAVIGALPAALSDPHLVFDSYSYLHSPSLHSYRLFEVPTLYLLLGHNFRAIVIFQAVVGAVCWSWLALEARHCTRRPWSWVALAGVLLVECSDYVSQWYAAILSDSLSLSFFALLLAVGLRWVRGRGSVVWVVLVSWLWAFTRNTNGYLLVVVGAVGLAALVVPAWRSRRSLLCYGSTLLVGVVVIVASATGSLYKQPIQHVVLSRVLPSTSQTNWFVAHGMPISAGIRALSSPAGHGLSGAIAYNNHLRALQQSPAMADYRAWVDHSGERVYLEYSATHPGWVLAGTLGNYQELNHGILNFYTGTVSRPWYPNALASFLLTGRRQTVYAFLTAALAALVAVAIWRRSALRDAQLRWWAAVVATGILTVFGDWVGDSYEVGRHLVGATVQITIGACFLVALCLAYFAPRRREAESQG